MIADIKPYPAMRISGVEWLGEVPQHWDVLPLKYWLGMNRAVLPETTDSDFEFQYLDIGSVGTGVVSEEPQRIRFADAPSRARRVVRDGDTIVSTVRTYLKAVWSAEKTDGDLICSTGFAVLSPREGTLPRFVSYLARSRSFTDGVTAASVGIAYPAIAESQLGALRFSVPPLPEQAAIVRYLDYVDRRVRRLVGGKRKLIALLTEQKQAIIHRAVTRGLDPDVPLKDSGVEWLGDMPDHWDVLPGRACVYEKQESNVGMVEDTVLSLSYGRIIVKQKEKLRGLVPDSFETYQVVDPGDIICRPTDLQNDRTSLRFGISRDRGIITSAYICFGAQEQVDGRFGHLLFHAYDLKKVFYGLGSGLRQNLSWEDFKYLPCVTPPLPEQVAIVRFLERATAEIGTAVSRTQREIDLLTEYRTRLIADVVTGKLDVREAAAALPEVDPLDTEQDLVGSLDPDTETTPEDLDALPEVVDA